MNHQITSSKRLSPKEKFDFIWNIIFSVLLFFAILGNFPLFFEASSFNKKLREANPSYPFPKFSDFFDCIPLIILIIAAKFILELAFVHVAEKIISKRYKNPKDVVNYQMKNIIKRKIATHLFKILYYSGVTIFGYCILYDLDYFPKSLLGNGYMPNMFAKGYPASFYHKKPKLFNLYYLFCLSYSLCEMMWILFDYGRNSELVNMLLHHVCQSSLIAFSYITNYSTVGTIVLFLHNQTDIFVHLTRLFIRCEVPEFLKNITGVILTLDFLYVRLYVFGDVIYTIYFYITWEWGWITRNLWSFLVFLYILHINWGFLLIMKAIQLAMGTKLSDTSKEGEGDKVQEKERVKSQ